MHRWCLLNLIVQGFSLNLTVRGVSHKHCLLTFFIFAIIIYLTILAHLSQRLKVSYCDHSSNGICRLSIHEPVRKLFL